MTQEVSMSIPAPSPLTLRYLKRTAKRRAKQDGIQYSAALETVSKEHRFQNWNHAQVVLRQQEQMRAMQAAAIAPLTPTRPYSGTPWGPHCERPDVVVPLDVHRQLAKDIRATMIFAKQRLRASCAGPLDTLRSTLDDWVGLEHRRNPDADAEELMSMHYSGMTDEEDIVYSFRDIDKTEHARWTGVLTRIRETLRSAYGNCKPLDDAVKQVNRCMLQFDKWLETSDRRGAKRNALGLPNPVQRVRTTNEWLALCCGGKAPEPPPPPLPDISRNFKDAAQAVRHALALVKEHLTGREGRLPSNMPFKPMLRRDLPYVINSLSIRGEILVNRDYKPVGHPKCEEHLVYEEFPNLHIRLSDAERERVVEPGRTHGLFGDSSSPWRYKKNARAYEKRLQALLIILEEQSGGDSVAHPLRRTAVENRI
jgi:Domain of unknown function (DUF5623)